VREGGREGEEEEEERESERERDTFLSLAAAFNCPACSLHKFWK
jgi:hypothetical protein